MVPVSRPIWRGWRRSSRRGCGERLGELMNRGLVTNDRFDPLRARLAGGAARALSEARQSRRAGLSVRVRPRRSLSARPEGRWSRLDRWPATPNRGCLPGPRVLVERYGVLSREVVAAGTVGPVLG